MMLAQQDSTILSELQSLFAYLTPHEIAAIDSLLPKGWTPLPGPQTAAYDSPADILFYGGAAGGGKSDLLIGLATTRHEKSVLFRKVGTELQGLIDRCEEMTGQPVKGNPARWKDAQGRQIDFASLPNPGDEKKYQGRPHDLIGFDEITNFLELEFRFLTAWNRNARNPKQRCRIVCTGNPPIDSTGDWVIKFWGPWLDKDHPNPAQPGELRWFTTIDGQDREVERFPFRHQGRIIKPMSRTFIPARLSDNPFLTATEYANTLNALPEPLRSKMLLGDFAAGREDNTFQVIPTEWVNKAQERWRPDGRKGPMDSVGLDVARGGNDATVVATRYGTWYDELKSYPGSNTPDGSASAGVAVAVVRDGAPIHVDVIGVGSSPYDHLKGLGIHCVGVCGSEAATGFDKSGRIRFVNYRAQLWWQFREALDPATSTVALPPGQNVRADLIAPRWKLTQRGIQIEGKEELIKRLGRSPDKGDALVYASINTPKRDMIGGSGHETTYKPW